MVCLDIALPRDLDPEIASVRSCYLYNVDDLAGVVAADRVDRSRDLERATAIVREESAKFKIRAGELRRVEGKLGRLSPRERQLVESLTVQIMNTFLHEPTLRMKRAAAGPAGQAYAGAVQHLFGIGEEPG